jgi:replicative DNA helicase
MHKKGYRDCFQVHVQSTPVQQRFLELVGSYGARGAIVKDLQKALAEIAPLPNTDTIPQEVWNLVEEDKTSQGMSWRDVASEMQTSYNGSALMTTSVSRTRLAKVAKVLKSDRLVHLAESDLYWDEISSITPLGVQEVFDASVPGTHNFVAGDMVVHNSIEQDADVVMFIHREDRTKEDSDRKNIAEILVEKHRNGPTGKIELYFDEKRTSYMPMDKSGYGDLAGEF